jgi:hypothetical protein
MQRRPGKALAHIAPPIQSPSSSSSSEVEKVSVLNQRLFGVTNRIWIIISVFLFLVAFTHFVLPKNHPVHHEAYSTANLKPKNYINSSDTEPNPFAFCPLFGPGDDIGAKYGSLTLSQSRLHLGSGARIQRVIHRALLGHPITISVVGGSGESIYLLQYPSMVTYLVFSFRLPWCRGGSNIARLLSLPCLSMVELRLPTPCVRTHQRCSATDKLGILWLLQRTPYP